MGGLLSWLQVKMVVAVTVQLLSPGISEQNADTKMQPLKTPREHQEEPLKQAICQAKLSIQGSSIQFVLLH